eukprot:scaffold318007_cov26-Tisochrysis_lutea.AAC.1
MWHSEQQAQLSQQDLQLLRSHLAQLGPGLQRLTFQLLTNAYLRYAMCVPPAYAQEWMLWFMRKICLPCSCSPAWSPCFCGMCAHQKERAPSLSTGASCHALWVHASVFGYYFGRYSGTMGEMENNICCATPTVL